MWTPESTSPLALDVSSYAIEETSMKIWGEFLAGWFNDASHIVAGALIPFPGVIAGGPHPTLIFQQMQLKQPLDGFSLHVLGSYGKTVQRRYKGEYTGFNGATFTFYIRASVTQRRTDGHNSISLSRYGADRLYGILLDNIACLPLNRSGITLVRPSPPKPVQSVDYATRVCECKTTLQFPVKLTAGVLVDDEDTVRAP